MKWVTETVQGSKSPSLRLTESAGAAHRFNRGKELAGPHPINRGRRQRLRSIHGFE
jgi:hypothetical protein